MGSDADRALGLLATDGWLSEQPDGFRTLIAAAGRWRVFEADALIYEYGDAPDGLYGLAEGTVSMSLPYAGQEPVKVHRWGAGMWVGDMAMLAARPRLATVHAVGRVRVFFVPTAAVRRIFAETPDAWEAFYDLTYRQNALFLTLLAEALALGPLERVARRLLWLADGDGVVVMSRNELAEMLGVTRSTVTRALAELTRAGAVDAGYRMLRIRDRPTLERFTDPLER